MIPPPLVIVPIWGLMVGSFLNVCISRLPAGESVVAPASRCPSCRQPIRWRDNLPVVSYLWLRGRCRQCGADITVRYPAVELLTAALFAAQAWWHPEWSWLLAQRLTFTALLVALAATDLETFRLPDPLTLGGLAAGLAFSVVVPPGLWACLLGAAAGAGVLWFVRWAWLRWTGTDAMGLGDVKMLAMIGAFLGWQQVWVVLLLSTVSGALVGIALAAAGRGTMRTRLPFGVFLAAGAWTASVVGPSLVTWYLGLFP